MLRSTVVLLFVALIVLVLTACGSEMCPTDEGDFNVGPELEKKIWIAVSSKLNNPSSYQPIAYAGGTTQKRPDSDVRYYNSVLVGFTADNAFGGRVQGRAGVVLEEDPDKGCVVVYATLQR